jgi:TP901 family phage tail tape measure protein
MADLANLAINLSINANTAGAAEVVAALGGVADAAEVTQKALDGSAKSDGLTQKAKATKKATKEIEEAAKNTGYTKLVNQFKKATPTLAYAGALLEDRVTEPIVNFARESLAAANSYETALTGVTKTTGGTSEQVARLSDEIKRMSRETGFSAIEIAGVAQAAGQLGVGVEDVAEFSRVMIEMGSATELGATDAAIALAQFANITGMPVSKMRNLGSAIVTLGNNFATSEPKIVDMGLRLASAGSQIDMTDASIMGLAAALSSVGLEAEAGGTAFSRVILNMDTAASKGKDGLSDFAKVAGLTTGAFTRLWEKDATQGVLKFIEGLGRVEDEGGNLAGTLEDLDFSDVRVRDTLMRSAGAYEELARAIKTANEAYAENTALTIEFDASQQTVETSLNRMRESITNMKADFGELFAPLAAKGADFAANVADWFGSIPDAAQLAIGALAGLTAAVGPVLTTLAQVGTVVGNWGSLSKIFVSLAGAIAPLLPTIGAVAAGIAAAGAIAAGIWAISTSAVREYEAAVKAANESSAVNMDNTAAMAERINNAYSGMERNIGVQVDIQLQGQEHLDKLESYMSDGKMDKDERKEFKLTIGAQIDADIEGAETAANEKVQQIKDALSGLTMGEIDLTGLSGEVEQAFAALYQTLSTSTSATEQQLQQIQLMASNLSLTGEQLNTALEGLNLNDDDITSALSGIETFREKVLSAFESFGVQDEQTIQNTLNVLSGTISQFYEGIKAALAGGGGDSEEEIAAQLAASFPDVVGAVTDWISGLPEQINGITIDPIDLQSLIGKMLTGADTSEDKKSMGLTAITDEQLKSMLDIDGLITRLAGLLGAEGAVNTSALSTAIADMLTGAVNLEGMSLWTESGLEAYAQGAVEEITALIAQLGSTKTELNSAIDSMAGLTGDAAQAQLETITGLINQLVAQEQRLSELTDKNVQAGKNALTRVDAGLGTQEDKEKAQAYLTYQYQLKLEIDTQTYEEEKRKIQEEIDRLTVDGVGMNQKAIELKNQLLVDLEIQFKQTQEEAQRQLAEDYVKILGVGLSSEIQAELEKYGEKLDAAAILKGLLKTSDETDTAAKDLITDEMAKIISQALDISPEALIDKLTGLTRNGEGARNAITGWLTKLIGGADSSDLEIEDTELGEQVQTIISNLLNNDSLRSAIESMEFEEIEAENNPLLKYVWSQLKLGGKDGELPPELVDQYRAYYKTLGETLATEFSPDKINQMIVEALQGGWQDSSDFEVINAIARQMGLGGSWQLPSETLSQISEQIQSIQEQIQAEMASLLTENPELTNAEAFEMALNIVISQLNLDTSGAEPNMEPPLEVPPQEGGELTVKPSQVNVDLSGLNMDNYLTTGELSQEFPIGTITAKPGEIILNTQGAAFEIINVETNQESGIETVTLKPSSAIVDMSGTNFSYVGLDTGAGQGKGGGGVPQGTLPVVTAKVGQVNADISGATIKIVNASGLSGRAEAKDTSGGPDAGAIPSVKASVETVQVDMSGAAVEFTGMPDTGEGGVTVDITASLTATVDNSSAVASVAEAAAALGEAAQNVEIDGSEAIAGAQTMAAGVAAAMESGAAAVAAAASAMSAAAAGVRIDPEPAIAQAQALGDGVASGMLGAVGAVQAAAAALSSAAQVHVDSGGAFSQGAALGEGLAAGIESGVAKVQAASAKLAAAVDAANKISAKLEIKSPSRVMERIGRYVGEGLALGLNRGAADAEQSARAMADRVFDTLSGIRLEPDVSGIMAAVDGLSGAGRVKLDEIEDEPGRATRGLVQNVTINAPNPLSPSKAARELRKVAQELAMAGA